ncbi:hypothetical protein RFI_15312 [Reticulomyxa filosa]|uniref:Uncharacterized protein n=1 Tax=Reticulomyxa filosa TaxID=46433 RepID=X6N9D2_RETFI|nr:hypothetical protein RFI_15312 [Reticulomyxa filosa]|eukprot:ETO21892.1 hypothetical protein RFI_15312 [Reticulomyxa filosa]
MSMFVLLSLYFSCFLKKEAYYLHITESKKKKNSEPEDSDCRQQWNELSVVISQYASMVWKSVMRYLPRVVIVMMIGYKSTDVCLDMSTYAIGTSLGYLTGSMIGSIWIFPLRHMLPKINRSVSNRKELLQVYFKRTLVLTTAFGVIPLVLFQLFLCHWLLHRIMHEPIYLSKSVFEFVRFYTPYVVCRIYIHMIECSIGAIEIKCAIHLFLVHSHFFLHIVFYYLYLFYYLSHHTFQVYHIAVILSCLSLM